MSEERVEPGSEGLSAKIEDAERRLRQAADSAAAAEEEAGTEIRALEADLEGERLRAAQQLEELRREQEEALRREREAKESAIAAAEARLAEIERQVEAAERQVEAAERRAADAEGATADADVRVREAAAAWLRGQVEAIRREAGRR